MRRWNDDGLREGRELVDDAKCLHCDGGLLGNLTLEGLVVEHDECLLAKFLEVRDGLELQFVGCHLLGHALFEVHRSDDVGKGFAHLCAGKHFAGNA